MTNETKTNIRKVGTTHLPHRKILEPMVNPNTNHSNYAISSVHYHKDQNELQVTNGKVMGFYKVDRGLKSTADLNIPLEAFEWDRRKGKSIPELNITEDSMVLTQGENKKKINDSGWMKPYPELRSAIKSNNLLGTCNFRIAIDLNYLKAVINAVTDNTNMNDQNVALLEFRGRNNALMITPKHGKQGFVCMPLDAKEIKNLPNYFED